MLKSKLNHYQILNNNNRNNTTTTNPSINLITNNTSNYNNFNIDSYYQQKQQYYQKQNTILSKLSSLTSSSSKISEFPVITQNNYCNNSSIIQQNLKTNLVDHFTTEYEINDIRATTRNILTKGHTQDEIAQYSGATISTRGRYIPTQDKTRINLNQIKPLYLFIQSNKKQSVSLAIEKIEEIINSQDNQVLSSTNRMTKFNSRPPPPVMAPQHNTTNQQNSTFVEKLMIGLDHAPQTFNLREQVIGAGGANLNYIRNETGAIATLRGRGSMFIDPILGVESPEPLHLYIEHPRFEGLQAAKQLAKNLIETLQQELAHFQQISQTQVQNASFSSATGTPGGTIIQQTQSVPQINVPPPSLLAVPPPIIQQNTIDPQSNQATIVQQNFIQQNPPPTLGGPPQTVQSQPQTIIHQQIIPQTVPIQLPQGNMVIQQPVQQPPAITNVNIPPPGIPIPIKTGQIVQFQQPPPPPGTHLTQPPPNVQLQHSQPAATTQIVLNHPQNYQYQYIQQPVQTNDAQLQPNQVTIQHIYQPQQQIQGIVQQTPQAQGQPFDQFQHVRSQQFQTAPPQQYITVQGSTAYMVPPPTIIQQQSASQPQQQTTVQTIASSNSNIIFQPPPQLQQVQMQVQPATISVQNLQQQLSSTSSAPPQEQGNQTNISDENRVSPSVKDDIKSGSDNGDNSLDQKSPDIKLESDSHSTNGEGNNESSNQLQQQTTNNATTITMTVPPPTIQNITIRPPPPPPQQQQQMATTITLPGTQVPPPIMAVPPPVQHFVGNTLITAHPQAQTHTNQIYNQVQVPVSIQQIQSTTGQQIHVSTPTGQHFLVNATPQWPTTQQAGTQLAQPSQVQQIQSNGTIQNVQITHQIAANTSEFRAIPPPGTTITGTPTQSATQQVMTFNPHHVQVQLQPQMIQQVPSSQHHHIEHAQLIGSQITVPPPTQQFNIVQTQPPNIQMTSQGQYQQQQTTFMAPFQQQIKAPPPSFNDQGMRSAQKRKYDDDDCGPPIHQPRVGMGDLSRQTLSTTQTSNPNGNTNNNIQNNNGNGSNANTTSSSNGSNNGTSDEKSQNDVQHQQQQQQQQQQQMMQPPIGPPPPPPSQQNSQFYQDNRSFFHRDMNIEFGDGPPPPPPPSRSIFDNGGPCNMSGGGGNSLSHNGPRNGPRFHHNMMGGGGGGGGGGIGPPGYPNMRSLPHHNNGIMQDTMGGGNFSMHRMNFGPPPPPPPYRGDGPPNLSGGGYGPPPPPRFRGQW